MKPLFTSAILPVLLLLALCSSIYAAPSDTRAIVVFNPAVSETDRRDIVTKSGAKIFRELSIIPAIVVTIPSHLTQKVRSDILKHTSVKRFENDFLLHSTQRTESVKPAKKRAKAAQRLTWGIDRIDAELVWSGTTGVGVKTAVLDTGVDVDHPDLIQNLKGGTNIIDPLKHYDDDNGHGTHVAGTLAGVDNTIGLKGVAPDSSIYGVKVLDSEGKGWLSDVITGLEWSLNNKMHIINMSLGTPTQSPTLQEAVSEIYYAGIVQIASAGSNATTVYYPAGYEETIAVSAVDKYNAFATWSNSGERIDVAAPGVDIFTTDKNGGYATLSGTSMAAPHVAGTAALILENQPFLKPEKVRFYLTSTAEMLGLSNDQQGSGLLDAEEAALISEPNPEPSRYGKLTY